MQQGMDGTATPSGYGRPTALELRCIGRKLLTAAEFYDGSSGESSCFERYSQTHDFPSSELLHCTVIFDDSVQQNNLEQVRLHLSARFPILVEPWVYCDFGPISSIVWRAFDPDEDMYEDWRRSAWEMFSEMPEFLLANGFKLKVVDVEPLPGPWKNNFL